MPKIHFSVVIAASLLGIGAVSATAAQAQLNNPCPYQNNGGCDEPNGLNSCAWETDQVDCSNPNSDFGSGLGFAAGRYPAPPQNNSGALMSLVPYGAQDVYLSGNPQITHFDVIRRK